MLNEKGTLEKRLTIDAIQTGIFYVLFILLPFSIIPMPWDWTERGTSLLILILGTVIVFLELFKFIWKGKFSIFKSSVDTGILLLLLSSIISMIFSIDPEMSFWGVDMNLGSGLISLLAVVLVSFVMRSFIDSFGEIIKVLVCLSIGILIIDIFSIASFLNIHFLGFLPAYEKVFTYGLPWTLSIPTLLVLNGVMLIEALGLTIWGKKNNKKVFTFSLISLIFSLITILLFSINQGFPIILMLVVAMMILVYLTRKDIKLKEFKEKEFRILVLISLGIFVIFFLLLKIPQIKESILGSLGSLTQVSLGGDISWKIASSGLSNKFLRAIVGYGQSTFVMLYNLYKPATAGMLPFNNTNFYYGSNEIITNLAEGGFLWMCAWITLGYFMFKEIVLQIKESKKSINNTNTVVALTLGISSIFLYLSSFFCHFGIMLKLMLFVNLSLWTVSNNIDKLKIPEKFMLRMWAVNTRNANSKNFSKGEKNINISMAVLLIIGFLVLTSMWCKILVSDIYVASTEQYISSKNTEFKKVKPSDRERENFLNEALSRYSKAEELTKMNSLINRKLALLNLEVVSFYVEQYTDTNDQNKKEDYLDKISVYKREAINQVQKAIERDPQLYDNWKTASSTYMGLLSIGLTDYSRDALDALNRALDLNPTNYELYYNEAQVYLSREDTNKALAMLVKVLELNPSHVPSILLAGQINKELGKDEVYLSYLNAAKAVMEKYGQTNTDTYKQVVKEIQDFGKSKE